MKFLVDECLSVELVTIAADAGYEAHYVVHVGKAGWKDWNVLRHAWENDFVHTQRSCRPPKRLFKNAVDKLTEYGEPINHVLEVDLDGEDMIFDLCELPAGTLGREKK